MELYFVYGNKQKKKLVESDYADDIYDVVLAFFEEHKVFPHILRLERDGADAIISMPNTAECFCISNIDNEQYMELSGITEEYKY